MPAITNPDILPILFLSDGTPPDHEEPEIIANNDFDSKEYEFGGGRQEFFD